MPSPYMTTCPCGISRMLPADLRFGQRFSLVPCPICGSAPTFRFWRWFIWRVG